VRAPDDSGGTLFAALDELCLLGGDDDRAALDALRGRLAGQRLRVLVAGEAKRGKSTLVNALLGRALLPVGVTPLTALATTVRYGRDEGVSAVFRNGQVESFPLTALGDLVTERGNPANRRNLASVTVVADAPVLARGVELVDTPGTGSVYAHNTAEAETALDTMDAAVFVLTADPPVSASECELMARVAELSVTMFVVLNKADYLAGYGTKGGGDLAEALEFTARVACWACGSSWPGTCARTPSPPSRPRPPGSGRISPASPTACTSGATGSGSAATRGRPTTARRCWRPSMTPTMKGTDPESAASVPARDIGR
jgi:GTP-binding protein EngB required for normal cell division